MTYSTVGKPTTDIERQPNNDLPSDPCKPKNNTRKYACFYTGFLIVTLLLAGCIASLTVGLYYMDNPDRVQNITYIYDGCLISVNGTRCTLYTVPAMYSQSIPCNAQVPAPRPDMMYSCWYSQGNLYLEQPTPPDWPSALFAAGLMLTIIMLALFFTFLIFAIIDCRRGCNGLKAFY